MRVFIPCVFFGLIAHIFSKPQFLEQSQVLLKVFSKLSKSCFSNTNGFQMQCMTRTDFVQWPVALTRCRLEIRHKKIFIEATEGSKRSFIWIEEIPSWRKFGPGATDQSRLIPPREEIWPGSDIYWSIPSDPTPNFWVEIKRILVTQKKLTLTYGLVGLPLRSWPRSTGCSANFCTLCILAFLA